MKKDGVLQKPDLPLHLSMISCAFFHTGKEGYVPFYHSLFANGLYLFPAKISVLLLFLFCFLNRDETILV